MSKSKERTDSIEKKGYDILIQRGYKGFTKLDSGGQGNVYKTWKNGVIFACKVVHVENPKDPAHDVDLWRELSIIKNLKQPNCIEVVDLFRSMNKVYMIMRFMPNGTIGSLVRKTGPLCEWKAKNWFCPLARAVMFLHNHKIAHRDLKLDNILLDAHFNPKLTDFGFSRFVAIDPESGEWKKSNTFCGTPSYYAPEIVDKKHYDAFKADVWCLGICLFIMLNKEYPFNKSNRRKMYENQINQNYSFSNSVDAKISDVVRDLIRKLLEPDPRKRPSVEDICDHLWFPIDQRVKTFPSKYKL